MADAQKSFKLYYDRKRTPQPDFQIGESVWLNRINIRTTRPAIKFDDKYLGPFKILEAVNDVSFRLQLPPGWKIHDVFHVSLLERQGHVSLSEHAETPLVQPRVEEIPQINQLDDQGRELFAVAEILGSRLRGGKKNPRLEFLVSWIGMGPDRQQWVDSDGFDMDSDLVKGFYARYPRAAKRPKPQVSKSKKPASRALPTRLSRPQDLRDR
jgi:hypothetical protein